MYVFKGVIIWRRQRSLCCGWAYPLIPNNHQRAVSNCKTCISCQLQFSSVTPCVWSHVHKASSECVPCPSSFVCRLSKSVFVKDGRLTPWSRQRRMYGCGINQSTSKVTEKILVSNLCLYHLHSWLSGSLKTFLLPYVCILTWRYTLPY